MLLHLGTYIMVIIPKKYYYSKDEFSKDYSTNVYIIERFNAFLDLYDDLKELSRYTIEKHKFPYIKLYVLIFAKIRKYCHSLNILNKGRSKSMREKSEFNQIAMNGLLKMRWFFASDGRNII